MKRRHFFILVSRTLALVLCVGLFILLPLIGFLYSKKEDVERYFRGGKAAYQGIITLWNVDTFEGGSASRSSFLERVSRVFESKNKGAYIKVENMTIDEMKANISAGVLPSMFSFGKGAAGYLKEHFVTLENMSFQLNENFYSSGLLAGNFVACPWAYGGYALLSSSERIEAAGQEGGNLKELAFKLAFDKSYKKSKKHIYSITFGGNAINSFSRNFERGADELTSQGILDKNYYSQSTYDAYENYVNENAMMLLGTQRDIFRLENRILLGKESDLLIEPLGNWTDMVCYISVLATDKNIKSVSCDYIKMLLSENMQRQLTSIGLLSPIQENIYESGNMHLLEAAMGAKTKVENVF